MEDFAVIKQQIIDEMPAWVDELTRHLSGVVRTGSPRNVHLYLRNTAVLKNVIGFNEFTGEVMGLGACPEIGLIKPGRNEDIHAIQLKSFLGTECDEWVRKRTNKWRGFVRLNV